MPEPAKLLGSTWHEALERALEEPLNASRRLLLFFEARSDLTVEISSRTGPSSVQTSQRGISAASGPGDSAEDRWVHLSDPAPGDVQRLARSALDPVGPVPGPTGPPAPVPGTTCVPEVALGWLERTQREIRRLAPTVHSHGRWVQFDQRVLVGERQRGVVEDRRRGCRIRVQAWTEATNPALAVTEEVLRPRHPDSDEMKGPAPEDTARRLVERLRRRAYARTPPSGPRQVILGPGAGGVLVHEIVGHALEGDVAERGSWLTRAHAPVAPKGLTILDDPRRGRAPWRLDDEGQPSGATPLIGDGRVRSWLCDRTSARRTGRPPTGHGRRSSYREPIRPRMGCTFVAAGRLHPDEVCAGVDGIYVRRMEAASVDAESGRATFRVTDSDLMHRGRIEAALRPHLLFIDARETLMGVDRVARDLVFDTSIGSCQRDGQSLAVSVGAPTIRIGMTTVIV